VLHLRFQAERLEFREGCCERIDDFYGFFQAQEEEVGGEKSASS